MTKAKPPLPPEELNEPLTENEVDVDRGAGEGSRRQTGSPHALVRALTATAAGRGARSPVRAVGRTATPSPSRRDWRSSCRFSSPVSATSMSAPTNGR